MNLGEMISISVDTLMRTTLGPSGLGPVQNQPCIYLSLIYCISRSTTLLPYLPESTLTSEVQHDAIEDFIQFYNKFWAWSAT